MRTNIGKFLVAGLLLLAFGGCSEDNTATHDPSAPVVVNRFYPTSGGAGSEVIITGENFSENPAQVSVTIGETPVKVLGTNMNNIVVIIPKKAGSGHFEISISGREPVVSLEAFTYTYSATVSTLAGGNGAGYKDGAASSAMFHLNDYDLAADPANTGWRKGAVCVDYDCNVFVADVMNRCIRKITPAGEVTTYAGSPLGGSSSIDGIGSNARLQTVYGMDCDAEGNIWFTETDTWFLRKITQDQNVTTVCSCPCEPWYVAADHNNGYIYVSSQGVNKGIYRFDPTAENPETGFETIVTGITYAGIAIAADGSVYACNQDTHQIDRYILTDGEWQSEVVAGSTAGYADGKFLEAQFSSPRGLEFDPSGDLFVAGNGSWNGLDNADQSIRRLSMSDQMVSTVAGSSVSGFVNGIGTTAAFSGPQDLAIDRNGDIYVYDKVNNAIRKIIFE